LKDFSASVNENQLLCILGHNGAGKTTTINILTCLYYPTLGDARIYGQSVVSDMDNIRKIMGVCPQHDILWNELTAREHLEIFAELKHVDRRIRKQTVEEKLDDVGLLDVGDHLVASYSGGMKRRLSVAVSCIGEPKIIFMDEPTTGMDPVSRRHVWNLIQRLKHGRVIILTTHSMEEADVLGDTIAIMTHGTISCMGSPLHLKNRFGHGYRVNITARPGAVEEVKQFVAEALPESFLIAETAEYLMYGLPQSSEQIIPFFERIEQLITTENEDSIITDVGVSHTTLEEVFLRVTREGEDEHKGENVPVKPD